MAPREPFACSEGQRWLSRRPPQACFEGQGTDRSNADAKALAVDVLAPRFWDLDVPEYKVVVDQWSDSPDEACVVIGLVPQRISLELLLKGDSDAPPSNICSSVGGGLQP